jgi:DNA-binding NarL/FixJ family response regulator
MHTGMSDARDRAAAYRAGAVAFLQKGIPLEELAERLRQIITGDR